MSYMGHYGHCWIQIIINHLRKTLHAYISGMHDKVHHSGGFQNYRPLWPAPPSA